MESAVVFPEQMNIIADVQQVRTVACECLRILPLGEHQLAVQGCVQRALSTCMGLSDPGQGGMVLLHRGDREERPNELSAVTVQRTNVNANWSWCSLPGHAVSQCSSEVAAFLTLEETTGPKLREP